ncbi:MAG: glycogen synthase [Alphaproteobacteria bacterium]|nr:glycogen synthase [Alphaproteobacteria bacterium]MCB9690619.1 glycogen synthase [Alphaproteobacteria bacterium]
MDVLFVASEMAPFSKTGGLGDVAGALPKALAARGDRVIAVSPRYSVVPEATDSGLTASIWLYGRLHRCRLFVLDRDGVRWVLVDNACYHREGIYGDSTGAYDDNLFRYALLCRVAIEVAETLPALDGKRLERPVFHANDWHTGLLPVYLAATYKQEGRLHGSRVVLGLHNLGHQGTARRAAFEGLGLPRAAWPLVDMHGHLNPLKAGIVASDAMVAVSPTYSRQIQVDQGFGLEGVLRERNDRLIGIVNGIGPEWDPATDTHLPATYTADDLTGKAACKAELQRSLGLPVRDVPVFGMVSRLDHQKGVDLVEAIAPWLLSNDVQLVMLGSGSERYERFFRQSERRWPRQARGYVGFSEPLAHLVEAGSDVFLMPSRFEPCGLNQLYSMRYGAVPVVHATGGLADTVTTASPGRDDATGWAFRPHSVEAFQAAVGYALLTLTRYPEAFARIRENGMRSDWSWDRSAARYQAVYRAVQG